MQRRKELRPLSSLPPPRDSGFSRKQPLEERRPPGNEEMAEFYRSVFERSSECIFICGLDGRFIDANDPALAMLGMDLDSLRATTLQALISSDQLGTLHSSAREIFETGSQSEIHRIRLRSADGRDIVVAARASLMMEDERPSAVLCIARDVTEFIALQEELRRSAALAAAGLVAGKAGHDIRNLLSPSTALIDYLLNTDPANLTPERIGVLRRIATSADEAMKTVNALIGKMMVLSAPGMKNADEVDLNPLLRVMAERTAIKLSEMQGDYAVDLDLSDGLRKIRGDRVELDLTVLNIVTNAIEAMQGGGRLSIRSENVLYEGAQWVKLTVRDSGRGMTPETLDRIFEPHFSTKDARGTGLGLAIVSKTVADHNGMVHVTSEPGNGTAFELYFPAI